MSRSDDDEPRRNQLSIDTNYMGSDIVTDLISSMVCGSELLACL
jgi:hypothetical protein